MPYILKDRVPVELTARFADERCREWCCDHADEMIVAETIWPNGMSVKTVFRGEHATPVAMFDTEIINSQIGMWQPDDFGHAEEAIWFWPSWGVAEEGHVRAVIAVAAIYDVEQLEKRAEKCALSGPTDRGPKPR